MSKSKLLRFAIDYQGFQIKDSFIFKEVAIINVDSGVTFHIIVKAPYDFIFLAHEVQNYVVSLENYGYKIRWDDGFMRYDEVIPFIQKLLQNATHIFAKGYEKCKLISHICNTIVIDLESVSYTHLTLPTIYSV